MVRKRWYDVHRILNVCWWHHTDSAPTLAQHWPNAEPVLAKQCWHKPSQSHHQHQWKHQPSHPQNCILRAVRDQHDIGMLISMTLLCHCKEVGVSSAWHACVIVMNLTCNSRWDYIGSVQKTLFSPLWQCCSPEKQTGYWWVFGQQYQWLVSPVFIEREQTLPSVSCCSKKEWLSNTLDTGGLEWGGGTDMQGRGSTRGFLPPFYFPVQSVLSFPYWGVGTEAPCVCGFLLGQNAIWILRIQNFLPYML